MAGLRTFFSVACAVIALVLADGPATSHAQTTRGTVADERGAPVAGVVVLLLDSGQTVVMRSLTNERGEYRVLAPRDGEYRIRTLRIGFRPTSYGPFTLRAGADVTQRLVVTGLPVSLATVSVIDRSPCRSLGDSTASTFLVWEQVRAALTAAQMTAGGRPMATTTVVYERLLDPRGSRTVEQNSSIRNEVMRQPWRSVSADSLRRAGYVVTHLDGSMTYYAPGLEVLLSDEFLEDHCFRMQGSPGADRVGIAFEPIPTRRRIPEIRGTVWLDRKSSQLRSMEFGYTNMVRERSEHAGGRVEFVGMASGEWVISLWEIRMPLLRQRVGAARVRPMGTSAEIEVFGIKVNGGELLLVRQGADTLWNRPPVTLNGSVVDSASGRPVSGARVAVMGTDRRGATDAAGRFSIPGVLLGAYNIEVATASLDSVAAVHLARIGFTDGGAFHEIRVPTAEHAATVTCAGVPNAGPSLARDPRGMIAGIVRVRGDSLPVTGAWVVAEWTPPVTPGGDASAAAQRIEEMTDARGMFRFCGIPLDAAVSLRVQAENHTSAPVSVRIVSPRRFTHVPLTVERVR